MMIRKLFFIVFLLGLAYQAYAGKSVVVFPTKGESVKLLINGKGKTYFRLTKSKNITLEVDGPGKLQVLNRLVFSKQQTASEKFTVKVKERSNEVKDFSTQTEPSDVTFKDSEMRSGKNRKFSLDIPDGTHTYTFSLENTNANEAVLKFYFSASKDKRKLVTIEPLSYSKIVTAVAGEKLITYYLHTNEQSVKVRVVGPTKMKISTRLSYDAKMKGGQKYTLLMIEKENTILTKPLSTTKSSGVIFKELKDVTPGKANSFYVDVPAGEHTYKFKLGESLAQSIGLKFSIPQQNLRNEE